MNRKQVLFLRASVILLAGLATGCSSNGEPDPTVHSPTLFGPHQAGFTRIEIVDAARSRELSTAVWYPALRPPRGTESMIYLSLLEGKAYDGIEADPSGAPYPLIMFSHGNQGIGVQSFTLCEHLASQGFVVAAPNHQGNTLFDSPSDEEVAQIALDRPEDIVFVMNQLLERNANPQNLLHGLIDIDATGIAGHSFGAYTTLVLADSRVDVDEAAARCDAGVEGDVFCPYVVHWPPGSVVERPPGSEVFRAALALAPGGYAAFGDEGLAGVDIPVMLMGGDLDDYTASDIRPIYDALPSSKIKIEIEGAGHMSFTDICRAELPVPELQELCDPEKFLDIERAFAIIDVFATAFFRYHLKDESEMVDFLDPDYASEFKEVTFDLQWP